MSPEQQNNPAPEGSSPESPPLSPYPLSNYLLGQVVDTHKKIIERVGDPDPASLDIIRNPDQVIKGSFWFGCWVATFVPEIVVLHTKALAEGLYDLARGQHKTPPTDQN